jgi:uncharacterized sulfatase
MGFGFILDFIFSLSFSLWLFIVYFLISLINRKVSKAVLVLVMIVMAVSAYGFSRYFALMFYPLDKVLFSYPISEVYYLAKTDGGIDLFLIISLIVLMSILYLSYYYLIRRIRFSNITLIIGAAFMLLAFVVEKPINNYCEKHNSRYIYITTVNKTAFFIQDCVAMMQQNSRLANVLNKSDVEKFQSYYSKRSFTSLDYPLLHKPTEESVLANFIKRTDEPPNIVIIVVESLTRCFSGIGAEKGSYTPFLDSLANVSLYWENFTSTSERTVGAIPGSLGSLPSSTDGFSTMAGSMPNYLSLVSILRKNQYQTNFFYGGIASSDNVNIFLTRQGLDNMQSGDYYSKNGKTYFGLTDSTIYNKSLLFMQKHKKLPFLNIYLTLSTHGPFDFPGLESMQRYVLDKWPQSLSKEQVDYLKNNVEMLASYYYVDQQIKKLFYAMKKNGDMDNTIFIVTGDHGVAKACPQNVIKKYHIPLILYSPQLKRSKKIKAINSHYNITPALLAFLKEDFQIETPKKVHWMGGDFDTSMQVKSCIPIPIMEINRTVVEMIYGNYFLSKGKLYQLQDGMKTQEIKDDTAFKKMNELLDDYVKVNHFVCNNNRLLPKSIYGNWVDLFFEIESFMDESILIDSMSTYVSFWENNINTSEGNYRIKLDFDLMPNNVNSKDYPHFVLELVDSLNTKISYNSLEWVNEWQDLDAKTKNHFSLSIETSISESIPPTNCRLKAYFWNNKGVKINLENVDVKIFKQQKLNN